jgi:hypothetical protein
MMTTSRLGQTAAVLLSAIMIGVMVPHAAQAYTPEQEQACTNDAFRLCNSEIPDVDRVTACMVRNKSQLSPPCRAQFGPEPSEASAQAGKPMSIRPAPARKPVDAKSPRPKKPARDDAS